MLFASFFFLLKNFSQSALLFYHVCLRLSSLFLKFFKFLFQSSFKSLSVFQQRIVFYHISTPLSSSFFNFFKKLFIRFSSAPLGFTLAQQHDPLYQHLGILSNTFWHFSSSSALCTIRCLYFCIYLPNYQFILYYIRLIWLSYSGHYIQLNCFSIV